ncbi:PfkB family carbohydrate kinase [Glaciibacter sp. 2TAF33]|uniref:PfkB family carbohydrate kinase n=1 Tax=Glaciibacter sp. 2TAF33 TaxID=3233015 RepID=UPI003F8FBD4E
MTGKIAVLSHVVVDEVVGAELDSPVIDVGGAGAYAAVGSSLAAAPDATVIVSGVGAADEATFSEWFSSRGVDTSGLFIVGEQSPRTRIRYFADGDRIETPVFGFDHFDAHTPLPEHIPYAPTDLAGVYLFHDHEADYWRSIDRFRAGFGGPLLWEISRDSCHGELWPTVRECLERVDLFSINRAEALELFDTGDLRHAIESLRMAGLTTVLRCGTAGSLVIDGQSVVEIGISSVDATDPTGGGNSYSGAFLSAFTVSGSAVEAARVAAAAAAVVVSQHGAPPIDAALRVSVAEAALRVSVSPR